MGIGGNRWPVLAVDRHTDRQLHHVCRRCFSDNSHAHRRARRCLVNFIWRTLLGYEHLWLKALPLSSNKLTAVPHRKLIADWNKFVGQYNVTVAPKNAGRPLAASGAQVRAHSNIQFDLRPIHKRAL